MNENTSVDNYSVHIDNITLVSLDGSKTLDIQKFIISLSIVEDIFSPFITCHLALLDYDQISSTFPLSGQEYLIVNFTKEKGGLFKQSSFTFLLYSQTEGGIGENNKFEGYVLNGVTIDRFLNKSLAFSKSYHNSYSYMVSDIFENYFSSTGKKIDVEQTKGIQKFIVPYISPFEAIEIIRKKSVSQREPFTPYLFFQNQEKYVFASYYSVFSNALSDPKSRIVHYYSKNVKSDSNRTPSFLQTPEIGQNGINDILSLSILNKYDTLSAADKNAFSALSNSFDLTTKSFIRRKFNLSDKEQTFAFGNKGRFVNKAFSNLLENIGSSNYFTITDDAGRYSDGSTQDIYPSALASMVSYSTIATQERIILNLYGDNNFKAGDSIFLGITDFKGTFDPTLAGSHLISTVRHIITFDSQPRYVVALECLKGNYLKQIENM